MLQQVHTALLPLQRQGTTTKDRHYQPVFSKTYPRVQLETFKKG